MTQSVAGGIADATGASESTAAARIGGLVLRRWPAARPFLFVGSASIVVGGVVAAVTRPTGFDLGPWLSAFLVLVGGVAQIALGVGQAWIAEDPPARSALRRELTSWNVSVVATVVGSLAALPVATTIGGIAMVAALVMFLLGVRRTAPVPRWAPLVYRLIVVVVLISTPIGLALAWVRHG